MKINFHKQINQSEINNQYLNLTDTDNQTYGNHFPDHLTRFIIIDGKGRITPAQQHHSNQIWGTLSHWYRANKIKAGEEIVVSYDSEEFNNGLHVLRLIKVEDLSKSDFDGADNSTLNGGGFGDYDENKKIEINAVEYVTKYYQDNGWAVDSVESIKCGFDLVCIKDNIVENVEVKGSAGKELSFMITANEVKQAGKNDNFILCVVTNAKSSTPHLSRYTGKEFIEKFSIVPVILKASIKAT